MNSSDTEIEQRLDNIEQHIRYAENRSADGIRIYHLIRAIEETATLVADQRQPWWKRVWHWLRYRWRKFRSAF